MKNRVVLPVVCLFFSIFLGMGCSAPQGSGSRFETDQRRQGAEARLIEVNGTAEISTDGAQWRKAVVGQPIHEGERLRTAPNSHVRVDLGEESGGKVHVLPGSVVIFEQLTPVSRDAEVGVILNLPQGRVIGDTARTPHGQKILVKTPNGMHEVTADGN